MQARGNHCGASQWQAPPPRMQVGWERVACSGANENWGLFICLFVCFAHQISKQFHYFCPQKYWIFFANQHNGIRICERSKQGKPSKLFFQIENFGAIIYSSSFFLAGWYSNYHFFWLSCWSQLLRWKGQRSDKLQKPVWWRSLCSAVHPQCGRTGPPAPRPNAAADDVGPTSTAGSPIVCAGGHLFCFCPGKILKLLSQKLEFVCFILVGDWFERVLPSKDARRKLEQKWTEDVFFWRRHLWIQSVGESIHQIRPIWVQFRNIFMNEMCFDEG